MNTNKNFDLIGIGAGPFNLSLLALAQKTNLNTILLEKSSEINWHREISFEDSIMQTGFLKDLVMTVDPTNSLSFLNYLVKTGRIYLFINTARSVVTRNEYEDYLIWAARCMEKSIKYNNQVKELQIKKNGEMDIICDQNIFSTKSICIATGVSNKIPDFAKAKISKSCFHAKSAELTKVNLSNKNVVIIGAGQTGIEIFRNTLKGKWGNVNSLKIIGQRSNLLPLDDSPFTNELFTPQYINHFYHLKSEIKDKYLKEQKLASDGNTPLYLLDLYRDLYHYKYVLNDQRVIEIMPNRTAIDLEVIGNVHRIHYTNNCTNKKHSLDADIIILASGFTTTTPSFLNSIENYIPLDDNNRLSIDFNFKLNLKNLPGDYQQPQIYIQNHSRHLHGVSEPQTSLMPWRSATILNSISKYIYDKEAYELNSVKPNLVNFCND